jgi:ABC-type multidrug transport system ATPase subunit
LSEKGVTFLLSSHILTELAQTATKFAFIHEGVLVKNLTQAELQDECKRALSIQVDDVAKASALLESSLGIRNYKQVGANELRVYEFLDNPSEITFQLNAGGVRVAGLHEVGDSLEDYYRSIIGGEQK